MDTRTVFCRGCPLLFLCGNRQILYGGRELEKGEGGSQRTEGLRNGGGYETARSGGLRYTAWGRAGFIIVIWAFILKVY